MQPLMRLVHGPEFCAISVQLISSPILRRMAKKHGIDLTIIVDIIHVIEYLWKAGRAFHPKSGPKLEKWIQHRLLKILEGKAGLMAGGMLRSATLKKLTDKQSEPVEVCATYLKNKAPYLKYDRYLDLGFPICENPDRPHV